MRLPCPPVAGPTRGGVIHIALLSQSARITDQSVFVNIAAAVSRQLRLHVAPLWDRMASPVTFYSDPATAPPGTRQLVVVDSPDQAGALGYHTETPTPGGKPTVHGLVFVNPVLDNGGTLLDGPNSIAAVVSHEALEMDADPNCNRWCDNGAGVVYALELCDACEADAYVVNGHDRPVSVSNFLLPSWFDSLSPAGASVDYLHKLPGPFSLDKGGYVVSSASGQPSQTFGDLMPVWRQEAHQLEGSRGWRRMQHLVGLDAYARPPR